jgi:hypothetical protein
VEKKELWEQVVMKYSQTDLNAPKGKNLGVNK